MTIEQKEKTQLEHVLVVEDDDDWQALFERSFQRRGVKATVATNVTEALELLEKNRIGINRVITDGLGGGWVKVAIAAQKLGILVKLVSADDRHKPHAKEMGIEFINKREAAQLRVRDQL